ncbi:MAG: NADH-quinone oxidoreductase subunit F [Candidatus Riflebacteria bacterium HGW-Riflebacteria-1]|jgi:NADH:ubiquinone oxidoreductase subunit F (NADH-binding)/(2Fe-2S) ferredoxin|nr:MAG: NADH-quinone oxidoreductase subunit F [Candidatus Riflebacteria bacterium HGW-Riflebacteria-1]
MMNMKDPCCSKCHHSNETPCPDLIECRISGPVCHDSKECRSNRTAALSLIRRYKVEKPVIFVGAGTCGLGAGAGKTLDAVKNWLKENKKEADVLEVGCIGTCMQEPMMDVQLPGQARVSFGEVTGDKAATILDKVFSGTIPEEHLLGQFPNAESKSWKDVPDFFESAFFKPQTRRVLANCGEINPVHIEEYMARGGYLGLAKTLKSRTPAESCSIAEESGLRGRGGGGFPTGKKWRFALEAPGDKKYLICNADEGDPGAFMDRAVIEGDPHRLLEGMMLGAYAIGASKAYIYIRAEYPLAIKRLEWAIAEAREWGLLGSNILDSGFKLEMVIKEGAGAFVCGEETALINSIEGKRGMPRPRPPFPAISGLFGCPTVINNVETLANLPDIFRNGAAWFKQIGTANSPGTKVFALSGRIVNTGLAEVAMGTPLRKLVFDIGGGIARGRKYKAVQIGGPSGGCVPEQHLDVEIDYESLKSIGAMMGSGGLVVMDETTCMVDLAKFFMDFIQRESCGKCIPCREGTRRILETLKSITERPKTSDKSSALDRFKAVMYMERLAGVIQDTSLCGLGQTAPNPVLSTLRYFRDEYEAHVYDRKCPAGGCHDLMNFSINADKCVGCTLCAKQCPTAAIMGKVKTPHYIIPDKCIRCGACYEVCKFKAVVKE